MTAASSAARRDRPVAAERDAQVVVGVDRPGSAAAAPWSVGTRSVLARPEVLEAQPLRATRASALEPGQRDPAHEVLLRDHEQR